jgi:hypothetical protein
VGLPEHLAGGDIEGGEQRGDAMPTVVVSAPLGQTRGQRQDRLGAVEGLDLGLLVHTKHERGCGRVQIEPDDVAHLLDQLGVVGELEVLNPVGLEPEGLPDPAHREVTETAALGHAAPAPMSGVARHFLQGGGHHRLHLVVADRARGPRARLVEEPRQSTLDVARPPLADGVVRDSKFSCHSATGKTVSTAQNDACALSQTVGGLGSLGQSAEDLAVFSADHQSGFVGAALGHDLNLVVRPADDLLIVSRISVPGH